tara:strand:+ start:581 stop:1267 length:687 start_codon:yes stop_codon:yes gene_type:complete
MGPAALPLWHAIFAAAFAIAGLTCATFHLGRPFQAWRSFLGWRKSWLSREILIFGIWSGMAIAYVGCLALKLPPLIQATVALGTVATGLLGVFCSVMVYVFTKRPFWSLTQTGPRFFLTATALGACFTFPAITAIATGLKLALEIRVSSQRITPFKKSAKILAGPLRKAWGIRLVNGMTGTFLSLLAVSNPSLAPLAFLFILSGELIARHLYFRAVEVPKMPGGVPSK